MSQKYETTPPLTDRMPGGIPYIVGNEAVERFSYYGMRAILVIFMTEHLLGLDGKAAYMSEPAAKSIYHAFTFGAYGLGIAGALIADGWLGKYRTIIVLSLVYCLGHVALSVDETRIGLFTGLALICIGAGGIKPCVSAHVGDQFGSKNKHLLPRIFSWFYFAINLGAAVSTLLTPLLLEHVGPWLAFGVPGALMFLATFIFWLGRRKFVHIPPGGLGFVKESFTGEGPAILLRLTIVFLFIVPFWALFDQTGSAWVLQADHMALGVPLWNGLEWKLLPSQIQAVNPFLILLFIPLFSYVVYPGMRRLFEPTPLRKIAIGMFLAGFAFMISAWIETRITAGEQPHIVWQVLAYVIITMAEVLISITCLEFAYTQAPPRMKSLIMSLFLGSIALGNALVSAVNIGIAWFSPPPESGQPALLAGAAYYWFFTGIMFAAACGFLLVLKFYRPKTYVQGERQPLVEDEV